jgi:hypothetical protein
MELEPLSSNLSWRFHKLGTGRDMKNRILGLVVVFSLLLLESKTAQGIIIPSTRP